MVGMLEKKREGGRRKERVKYGGMTSCKHVFIVVFMHS
jgi:hypothetical protein